MGEPKIKIGAKIRELRINQRRTLTEVAVACDISKSMLSKLENNVALPSVSTLVKVAEALGTSLGDLMQEKKETSSAFISKETALNGLSITDKGYKIFPFAAAFLDKKMQPFLFTGKKGEVVEHSVSHEGEEFIYIVSGELSIHVGEETFQMKEGDSIYFNATLKHGILPMSEEVHYIDIFV